MLSNKEPSPVLSPILIPD